MSSSKQLISQRQIVVFLVLAIMGAYSLPLVFDAHPPRLSSAHKIADKADNQTDQASLLQAEIASLQAQIAALQARDDLVAELDAAATEKADDAAEASRQASLDKQEAEDAFALARQKDDEAKQAFRDATSAQARARNALIEAAAKDKAAEQALASARALEAEAMRALNEAKRQARLAQNALRDIADLQTTLTNRLAALSTVSEQQADDAIIDDVAETKTAKAEQAPRRLPKPGKAPFELEDGLIDAVFATSLPRDLADLTVAERKQEFVSLLLPLIIQSNQMLEMRAALLEKAISTNDQPQIDRFKNLYRLSKFTGDDEALYAELRKRIKPIPVSLALAQAAVESGWGLSRFAKEGNALFGQWAWREDAGIKPLEASNNRAVIRSFASLYDSVVAYMHNLNTHYAYQDFRENRAKAYRISGTATGLQLADYLSPYAETAEKYVFTLKSMILQNGFYHYEGYQLASAS